jgi:hypothetical protein
MPEAKKPVDPNGRDGSDSQKPGDFVPARLDRGSTMGEILLREKLVNMTQLQEAQKVQRDGENLGYTLAKLGYLEETQLINFLSRQYGVPSCRASTASRRSTWTSARSRTTSSS